MSRDNDNIKMKMPYRFLGNTGILVSVFSLGSWVTFNTQTDEETSYELMKEAYKRGVNFFDNAEVYENGRAETIMGKAIAKGIEEGTWEREDLVVSTKLYFGDGHTQPNRRGLSRKHIAEGIKASLQRLQLDYVDLVLCHRPDPKVPIEETVRAMNAVINQGKAFYWGTSEWTSAQIISANEIADKLNLIPPQFEQPQYNIFERAKVDIHYQTLYSRYNYGLTIWSPLASGILTGKYSHGKVPEGSRMSLESYAWLQAYVLSNDKIAKADALVAIAHEVGCSLTQLAIAWCASNRRVSTVLLGAKNKDQLIENLDSLSYIKRITPEIRKKMEQIVPLQFADEVDPFPELVKVHEMHLEEE